MPFVALSIHAGGTPPHVEIFTDAYLLYSCNKAAILAFWVYVKRNNATILDSKARRERDIRRAGVNHQLECFYEPEALPLRVFLFDLHTSRRLS